MLSITSVQNPRVKEAIRLRDRQHRKKQGRILIDGSRELLRAIDANVRLTEVFICEKLCNSEESKKLLEKLQKAENCEQILVNPTVFEKLSFGDRRDGILAVAETPHLTLDSIEFTQNILVAVLEGIEKPGNIGAILRSADAAGVSAVILADCCTDLYNPNAIRASMGTIFTVPVCETTTAEVLAWLRSHEIRIFAARVDATMSYSDADFRTSSAIVLGSEAEGLSSLWNAVDIHAIRLPMLGIADSLNVSVTAAVLFYEALRQRTALA